MTEFTLIDVSSCDTTVTTTTTPCHTIYQERTCRDKLLVPVPFHGKVYNQWEVNSAVDDCKNECENNADCVYAGLQFYYEPSKSAYCASCYLYGDHCTMQEVSGFTFIDYSSCEPPTPSRRREPTRRRMRPEQRRRAPPRPTRRRTAPTRRRTSPRPSRRRRSSGLDYWADGVTCPSGALQPPGFHGEGYFMSDQDKAAARCKDMCDDNRDCQFAGLHFYYEPIHGFTHCASCYLYTRHCGYWQRNRERDYTLYVKSGFDSGRDLQETELFLSAGCMVCNIQVPFLALLGLLFFLTN